MFFVRLVGYFLKSLALHQFQILRSMYYARQKKLLMPLLLPFTLKLDMHAYRVLCIKCLIPVTIFTERQAWIKPGDSPQNDG